MRILSRCSLSETSFSPDEFFFDDILVSCRPLGNGETTFLRVSFLKLDYCLLYMLVGTDGRNGRNFHFYNLPFANVRKLSPTSCRPEVFRGI